MPQLDEREDLARHVAVLTPAADFVVIELGIEVPEGRRFRVLVHALLPTLRGRRADRASSVDERDRPSDPAGQLARRVLRTFHLRTAFVAAASQLLLGLDELGVTLGVETRARQHDHDRREQRA